MAETDDSGYTEPAPNVFEIPSGTKTRIQTLLESGKEVYRRTKCVFTTG
jgi:hypothetical protein